MFTAAVAVQAYHHTTLQARFALDFDFDSLVASVIAMHAARKAVQERINL
jgi:hypothetical protein